MKLFKLILLFSLLTVLSCSKSSTKKIKHAYFTKEYYNWAWGYQHNGWIINNEGEVYGFNLPSNWKNSDSASYISENDLLSNLSACVNVNHTVSITKLNKLNKSIKNISLTNMSELHNVGNDAGDTEYFCYLFDEDLNKYKKIRLFLTGDFRQENKSKDAKAIVKWMRKIDKKLN